MGDAGSGLKGELTPNLTKDLSYLDQEDIRANFLVLDTPTRSSVVFTLPAIHCSACIFLLENLPRIDNNIFESRVDFLNKRCTVLYDPSRIKLSEVAALLIKIGYKPDFNLSQASTKNTNQSSTSTELKNLYLKIGVAFFCWGNIMMLSLPDYLSDFGVENKLYQLLIQLQLLLGIPLLYSLSGYLRSAWGAIRARSLNLDVPISLGTVALFLRSTYEIISGTGQGYMDSLAGLALFLLIGRIFQEKTYQGLSFSRDHSSFFPLSVSRIEKDEENRIAVSKISQGDILRFRNEETIPVEASILEEHLNVDYSFVTGEADPIRLTKGEKIYPGGKVIGRGGRVVANKDFDQAYLNSLWQREGKKDISKEGTGLSDLSDTIAKWFTVAVLSIAGLSFAYWQFIEPQNAFPVLAAVLIVACPCALALSMPFTYGTVMRLLGIKGIYLKKDTVVEALSSINTVILDKTGTLSYQEKDNSSHLQLDSETINSLNISTDQVYYMLAQLSAESQHPISKTVNDLTNKISRFKSSEPIVLTLEYFAETVGMGIEGVFKDTTGQQFTLRLGSDTFTSSEPSKETRAYISLDSHNIGRVTGTIHWRDGLKDMISKLQYLYPVEILSGDTDKDKTALSEFGIKESNMHFKMKPADKAAHIFNLQSKGKKVLMLGDGLNDISALSVSEIGIAVTDDTNNFTPKSDGIMLGKSIEIMPSILAIGRKARVTVYAALIISLLYNIFGLYFALTAQLSPVFAALLMPISSVTVVALTVGKSIWDFRQLTKN